MKITPETKPISEIYPIEGDIHYIIPDYQRNYSWDTSNIDDLINDVIHEEPGYYIGNLLIEVANENEKSSSMRIVDGQQRLTTIALILLAMYSKLNSLPKEGLSDSEKDQIGSFKYDIKRKLTYNEDIPRLKLLESDHIVFEPLVHSVFRGELIGNGNRIIVRRFKHISEYIENNINDLTAWKNLYSKLNKIEILKISVSNVADAFSVFTSLNAKGMPLTLIDLLKSTYLGSAVKNGMDSKLALERWSNFTSIFYDAEEEISSTAITQFILNYYDTFINTSNASITKSTAIKEYRKLFETNYKLIDDLIDRGKEFSFITNLIKNHPQIQLNNDIIKLLESLQKLDSSQSYPLQMYLLKLHLKNIINVTEICKSLNFLISFFVRRNIILKPKSSSIRLKILDIVNEHKAIPTQSILRVLKNGLISISETDITFKNALCESVYDISVNTTRYILISLERRYGNYFDKQNPDTLDKYVPTKGKKQIPTWTIEHILPKTASLKLEWQLMISPDDPNNAKNIQEDHVHKLGNLTLTGYNSELSDDVFINKRDYSINGKYLGLRTGLFLNKSIPNIENDEKIEEKFTWDISDIIRRTESLSKLTVELFKLEF